MNINVTREQLDCAAALVAETRRHGGLAPVDLERFWRDDAAAHTAPFAADCPQVPLGIGMNRDCVYTELGEPPDWYRLFHDEEYYLPLCRRYNDRAAEIVGRRLLPESRRDPATPAWPPVKELHDIFEARNAWHIDSYWLQQAASTTAELRALLDRVEGRLANLREFLLPPGWDEAKERMRQAGVPLPPYRSQRGPVTFATSVFGTENTLLLILDEPDLAARFRDLILRAILGRARIIDEEGGYTPATAPRGFWWADDNCALLSPEMYEFFGYPILEAVFARYASREGEQRFQHSDSAMGHLLPLLGRLGLTAVNFGPTIMVADIRRHLPRAVVHGQLAPFTFSRHEEVNIVAEFLRDFAMARETKGLVFATAGSIHDGSRLTGLRLIMAAIQRYGRY